MALKVGELYALFSIQTDQAIKDMDGVQAQINAVGDNIIATGALWENNVSRPIRNWLKDMLQTGMDFGIEMANTTAKALDDLDPAEKVKATESLEKEALRVAKDSIYTSQEIASAYDKMAMAGWDWRSMIGGLEPIADLAAASGEGLERTSDIVTDAMTAFGLTWDRAMEEAGGDAEKAIGFFQGYVEHFTDVLAKAATSSNTTVDMMGESFKYVAPLAGALGYEIEDVALALAMMANNGIKGSQAGTILRRMMSNEIKAPSKDAQAVIDELGLSLYDAETGMLDYMGVLQQLREKINGSDVGAGLILGMAELQDAFYDESAVKKYYEEWESVYDEGKKAYDDYISTLKDGEKPIKALDEYVEDLMDPEVVKGFTRELDNLQTKLDELAASEGLKPDQLKIVELASEIFGIRALPGALAVITASDEEFNSLAESIGNADGATHRMKETMLDTTGGSLKMLYSSLDTLKVVLEKLVDDKLRAMIDRIRELVNAFTDMDEDTQMTILNIAGIAVAIGPAAVGVGTLVKLLPALGSAFNFVASPMGLVVTALGAMALSAMDSDGKISKAMGDIGQALGLDELNLSGFDPAKMLDDFLNDIGDLSSNPAVTGFMERLGEGFGGAMGFLGDLAGDIVGYILSPDGIATLFKAGGSIAKILAQGIKGAFTGAGRFGMSFMESLLGALLPDVDADTQAMLDQYQARGDELTGAIIETVAEGVDRNSAEYADLGLHVAAMMLSGMDSETALKGNDDLRSFADTLTMALFDQTSDSLDEYKQDVQDYVNDWYGGVDLSGFSDELWGILYKSFQNASEGRDNPWEPLLEYLTGGLTDGVSEETDAALQELIDEYSNAAETITDAMEESATDVGKRGFAKVLKDQTGEAEGAALTVSDAVVQQFLLTMSKENGAAVALEYLGGLEGGLLDEATVQTLSAAAISTAGGVVTIFENILSPDVGRSIGAAFGDAIAGAISAAAWGIDAQVQGIVSSVSAASMMAQEAVAGLVVPSGITASSGRGYGNGSGNLTAAQITGAVRQGFAGASVNMDGQKVGNIVTPTVSENIAAESVRRG